MARFPKRIREPRIVNGMPMEIYQADPCPAPALSNSIMKPLLQKSPFHAWLQHPRLNRKCVRQEDSKFDLGTASHALLLEGADRCTVIQADDWRTKAAKDQRELAWAAGKTPLLVGQYQTAQAMVEVARDFLKACELKVNVRRDGKPEQSMFWQRDGIWFKARTDWLSNDRSLVLDYKSTGVASPAEWIRAMPSNGYDTQSALYPKGLAALGHSNSRFVFLVQETCEPYSCYLVDPTASMLELADMKISRATRLWADCLQKKRWPGYPTTPYPAYAPQWALVEEEALQ